MRSARRPTDRLTEEGHERGGLREDARPAVLPVERGRPAEGRVSIHVSERSVADPTRTGSRPIRRAHERPGPLLFHQSDQSVSHNPTDSQQNVLEVYHRAKEVWYNEYNFRTGIGAGTDESAATDHAGEKKAIITCQRKAKICMEDIEHTLGSFAERSLSAGFEFCYTYSCNIKRSECFGLDYSVTPTIDTVGNLKPGVQAARGSSGGERGGAPAGAAAVPRRRERKKKIDTDIEVVREYFDLPMNVATQKLKIGSTALKKICRRYGITRWPYRRIKAIEKLIQQLEDTGATESSRYQVEGQAIRERLEDLYAEKEKLCLQGT